MPPSLAFRAGTIELRSVAREAAGVPSLFAWDERAACFRAPAIAYVEALAALRGAALDFVDDARADG